MVRFLLLASVLLPSVFLGNAQAQVTVAPQIQPSLQPQIQTPGKPYPGAPDFLVEAKTNGWLQKDFDTIREANRFESRMIAQGFTTTQLHFTWGHRVKFKLADWTEMSRYASNAEAQRTVAELNAQGLGVDLRVREVGGIYKSRVQTAIVIK
jgi:hypothetical protein